MLIGALHIILNIGFNGLKRGWIKEMTESKPKKHITSKEDAKEGGFGRMKMRFLMGIKNCHCCSLRKSCDLKNTTVNLRKTAKKQEKVVYARAGRKHVSVTSFCEDFLLEGGGGE